MLDNRFKITLQSARKRIFRFDHPASPVESELNPPESRSWLDVLRDAIRSTRKDMRQDERYSAVAHEIWVGWWTGEHFGAVNGYLENISKGGALILLGSRPPRNEPVWIYKELEHTMTCVRATTVGLIPAPDGAHAARFQFVGPCPESLRQSALSPELGFSEARQDEIVGTDDYQMC